MNCKKIDAAAQVVSRWSGGTTTQLAIFPTDALYADRDFLWRISSAVVELPESDFTPLPDYDRILMILQGELSLSHDGGAEYTLRAFEQTAFDGASKTFSRGQVTDFNLMMRKGRCTGRLTAWKLNRSEGRAVALPADYDTHLFYCVDGEVLAELNGKRFLLTKGEALLLEHPEGEVSCTLQGVANLVVAEIRQQ